jgi:hypothetical protein
MATEVVTSRDRATAKYRVGLDLAYHLAMREDTDVQPDDVLTWHPGDLYAWLEDAWGFDWNGRSWEYTL